MIWGLANMPLAGARNRGGGGGPFPGEFGRRRRGRRGGTARGGHALPLGGLHWGWGRPEGDRRLGAGPAAGGGAAPAVRGGGEQVWELHGAMRKLSWGSIWVKEGRRRGFDGELEWRVAMAGR